MAKKSRTPPPRPVQAPRFRGDTRRLRRPSSRGLAALAGLVLAAGAAAAAFFLLRGEGNRAVLSRAACTVQTVPPQASDHVEELPRGHKYNSFPPTTGLQYPQPAIFDLYTEPVEQYRLVHNLEHGAIAVQYGRGARKADIEALTGWYREDPDGIVVAPLPALGDRFALTAWNADFDSRGKLQSHRGVLARCPRFDADAFDAFVDEYGFRGPERAPRETLQPGT